MDGYTGQKLKTCRWVGVLSPGSYLIMQGKVASGVAINTALVMLIICGCLSAVLLDLFPVPLVASILLLYVLVWGYGMVRSIWMSDVVICPIRRIAHLSLAFLTFWMPTTLALYICTNTVIQRTWLANDTMNPGMLKGDVILVDRISHRIHAPSYGDLVMVDEPIEDRNGKFRDHIFFGRVIALAGDEVQLIGYHPNVNRTPLMQYYHIPESPESPDNYLVYEIPADIQVSEDTESEPSKWYPILSRQPILITETNEVKLSDGFYYVLQDNRLREPQGEHRKYGAIVHKSQIMGTPKYVIYNTELEDTFARYGIALR